MNNSMTEGTKKSAIIRTSSGKKRTEDILGSILGFLKKSDTARISWFVSDASNVRDQVQGQIDAIVTEGDLGKPLNGHESLRELEINKRDVETIWNNVLPAFSKMQPVGGRLVCVWPTMKSRFGTVTVDPIKTAEASGYTLISKLVYARPDQNIRRNIVILEKKVRQD